MSIRLFIRLGEIIRKVKVKVVKAGKFHSLYKYGINILSSGLILGCATAPPTQEMSDARQSVEAAESIGADVHAPVALDSAHFLLSKAQDDMQAGQFEKAQKEALAAREAARQAVAISQAKQNLEAQFEGAEVGEPEETESESPEESSVTLKAIPEPQDIPEPVTLISYTVKLKDNLWKIAAQPSVYGEPLLWPLILKSNPELIRNADDTRNTPVVMLSSSDGIFDIAKGRARGATAHVTKIPPESVLRELIYNHTNSKAAA